MLLVPHTRSHRGGRHGTAKIAKSAIIHVAVEKVFRFLSEPQNRGHVWPDLIRVEDVQRLPGGGYRYRCFHNMLGIGLTCTSEDVTYIPNQCIVTRLQGGIEGTITMIFRGEGDSTRLTIETGCCVVPPLWPELAEAFVAKQNEDAATWLLDNLKIQLEPDAA